MLPRPTRYSSEALFSCFRSTSVDCIMSFRFHSGAECRLLVRIGSGTKLDVESKLPTRRANPSPRAEIALRLPVFGRCFGIFLRRFSETRDYPVNKFIVKTQVG